MRAVAVLRLASVLAALATYAWLLAEFARALMLALGYSQHGSHRAGQVCVVAFGLVLGRVFSDRISYLYDDVRLRAENHAE